MHRGIRKISDDIFMLTLPMPFRLNHVNIFAVVKDGLISLIDTGPNFPGVFEELEGMLKEIGHGVADIDQIFITHSHVDHCGLAGSIQDISGAAIYMHQAEYTRAMADTEGQISVMRSFYRQEGLSDDIVEMMINSFLLLKDATHPFVVKDFLVPGEIIRIHNDIIIEVIGTPGHTSGQVIFFLPGQGLLFSGDHVLPHITPNLGPDLADKSFCPLKSFIESLEKIKALPVSIVYPAHGKPFKDLIDRTEEIIAHHDERKRFIISSVHTSPKTAQEISEDIFGDKLPDFDKFLAFNETYVHLMELEAQSLIKRTWVDSKLVFEIDSELSEAYISESSLHSN